jgi:hypothetical protein
VTNQTYRHYYKCALSRGINQSAMSHLDSSSLARHTVFDDDNMREWETLAMILGENGWTWDALEMMEQVGHLRRTRLGEDHPSTLRSIYNLANCYSEAGQRAEALQLTEQVVYLFKTKLGEDHLDTLRSMHSLAIRYSEAAFHCATYGICVF